MTGAVRRHALVLAVGLVTASVSAGAPALAAKAVPKAKKAKFAKNAGKLDGLDSSAFAKPGDLSWSNLAGIPAGFADGTDNVGGSAEDLNCASPCVSAGELDFDPATQGELDGHHDAESTDHDDRYYTESELDTSGAGGMVHWDNLTNVPAGFADDVDDVDGGTASDLVCAACVSTGELDFDPATQSELDGHNHLGEHWSGGFLGAPAFRVSNTDNGGIAIQGSATATGTAGLYGQATSSQSTIGVIARHEAGGVALRAESDGGDPFVAFGGGIGTTEVFRIQNSGAVACPGCIGISDLGFDPATQPELDGHHDASSTDHDDRYYTEPELNTSDADDPNMGANRVHWDVLTGVPTDLVDGDDGGQPAWLLAGNAGTVDGTDFLGTTVDTEFDVRVNDERVARFEPDATSPSVIFGFSGNDVSTSGATVGGGGSAGSVNLVTDNFGTVSGGANNQAGDGAGTPSDREFATVGGGIANTASGAFSTIGGGRANDATGTFATVGGGLNNQAITDSSTIGGGQNNSIPAGFAESSTIAGGTTNTASGQITTVGGGQLNTASGGASTIPGGSQNTASGMFTFASGRRAVADDHGAWVWSDSCGANGPSGTATCPATAQDFDFVSVAVDEFAARATGGVRFVTAVDGTSTPTAGVSVAAGGTSWSALSDEESKENVVPVDGREILDSLLEVPIATWNARTQDPSIRHIGPMAQDFYAAFGVGEDERHITTIDADGVALAAIQGLGEITAEQEETIAELRASRAPSDGGVSWVQILVLVMAAAAALGVGLALGGALIRKAD
ncbi:MAG: tail fiber domain-containing protein [Actinomycetota bacterium]